MSTAARTTLVVGEALIDAVDTGSDVIAEHVGGSPANVAFGLGALDHDVALLSWFGQDPRGERIAATCARHGVRIAPGSDGADHTSVAHATIDARGQATYHFDLTWQLPRLADLGRYGHVHTGSIAATLEPGGSQVLDLIRTVAQRATVSYDPNIRPTLMGSPDQVRERIEAIVALSDVVKASDEDLHWLYPGEFVPDVLRHWMGLGPSLTVVTRGAEGAVYAVRSAGAAQVTTVPARAGAVVDTVGAGDSFMAGLVSGLLDAGLLGDSGPSRIGSDGPEGPRARQRLAVADIDDVQPAVERAIRTSGATVARAGAYAPGRSEIGS
ncbi:MAG TPA: PfkB family carbohydrate kinase [Dermatophilaceae bacterium]|nr:PfkB family carbohydrate kinase [Dermatophilaceae bacterium]